MYGNLKHCKAIFRTYFIIYFIIYLSILQAYLTLPCKEFERYTYCKCTYRPDTVNLHCTSTSTVAHLYCTVQYIIYIHVQYKGVL